MLSLIRTWIPAALCVAGIAYIAAHGASEPSLHVGIPLFSAGASIWLLNVLYRVGVRGDTERSSEEIAREFQARHGRWPTAGELRDAQSRDAEHGGPGT